MWKKQCFWVGEALQYYVLIVNIYKGDHQCIFEIFGDHSSELHELLYNFFQNQKSWNSSGFGCHESHSKRGQPLSITYLLEWRESLSALRAASSFIGSCSTIERTFAVLPTLSKFPHGLQRTFLFRSSVLFLICSSLWKITVSNLHLIEMLSTTACAHSPVIIGILKLLKKNNSFALSHTHLQQTTLSNDQAWLCVCSKSFFIFNDDREYNRTILHCSFLF